jgi:hypothetical protein
VSVHVAFDIYPAATPNGSLLVRLLASGTGTKQAVELSARKVLHGSGEGMIRIHSSHAAATSANFTKRNYVKVVLVNGATETEWFGFFMEQGDFGAISRREQAGRMLTFSGPGSLFYLDRALLLAEIYAPGQPRRGNLELDGQWGWNDIPYGAIMTRAMEEGYYAPGNPLFYATWDFSRTEDSAAVAWPNIDNEFTVPWGTSVYDLIASFIKLGLVVTVDADLTFHAWQTYGTNRTSATFAAGKIRFAHGVNIGNEVTRQIRASLERSHIFVVGDEFTSAVVSGGSSAVTYYDTLQKQETNDSATLTAAGDRDLAQREIQADAAFPVRVILDDDELNGLYVPGEHYDVGDIATIHTVPPSGASGEHDFTNFAIEVAAIKVEHDDAGNWFAVNELGAQYLSAQLSALEVPSSTIVHQIELCRPPTIGLSEVKAGLYGSNTPNAEIAIPTDTTNAVVLVFLVHESDQTMSVSYEGVAMTAVPGSLVTQTTVIPGRADHTMAQWYYATVADNTSGAVRMDDVDPAGSVTTPYWGWIVVADVDTGNPIGTVATAIGTSATPATSNAGPGTVITGFAAWGDPDTGAPTMAAPGTLQWGINEATGLGALDAGIGYGDATPSFTMAGGSKPWVISAVQVNGVGGGGTAGDAGPADTVLQGAETHGTSIRATRCDHAHAHGLLSDLGTHYHEADQIDGLSGADLSGIDFLVGTASGLLSTEIVVGGTPGGELGGTWASPTVDATHAGSNHLQPVRKNSAGSVFTRRQLNFIEGTNVTLTVADDAGNDEVDITIASSGGSSGVTVQDEGTPLATDGTTLNFVGAGVTATGAGATKTITIPGGGGGGGGRGEDADKYNPDHETPATTPADAEEFNGSTGMAWTSAPGVIDSLASKPGFYHIRGNTTERHLSKAWTPGATDLTIACKFSVSRGDVNTGGIGLYVGDATGNPANLVMCMVIMDSAGSVVLDYYNENGAGSFAQIGTPRIMDTSSRTLLESVYLRLTRLNSGPTWTAYVSTDGRTWMPHLTTGSKSLTVGAFGMRFDVSHDITLDWIRVWSSIVAEVGA